MFRVVIPFPYISEAFLFIGINVTDFLEQFEDIAINYKLSDNRKM